MQMPIRSPRMPNVGRWSLNTSVKLLKLLSSSLRSSLDKVASMDVGMALS